MAVSHGLLHGKHGVFIPGDNCSQLSRPACARLATGMLQHRALMHSLSTPRPRCRVEGVTNAAARSDQKEDYDVYVYQPQPLEEGEEKHTISVFVADEAGIINRVAGVFARRGANIESLAVGLNVDKALFTIVVTGRPSTIANLVKQLSKLVKVRYVEDITSYPRIERELVLLKVSVAEGPDRTEVLQLAQIFRARVVDVSDRSVTLAVTGDAGKTAAFQKVMNRFGITEAARTGKIALKRGEDLLEDSTLDMEGGANRNGVSRSFQRQQSVRQFGTIDEGGKEGDVYSVEADKGGVWNVQNVLEAGYNSGPQQYEPHTLSIEVQDIPGVLNQVTGVFARRGYNVQSLAVGPSEVPGMSRICLVVPGTGSGISNLIKQINKLVFVQLVTDVTNLPKVSRELMLIKVRCSAAQRGELRDLAEIFHGQICDVSLGTVTIEVTGKEPKMQALQQVLEPYGLLETARTGRVALLRDSGVDTRLLDKVKVGRIML